jgi:hypothetical protein
MWQINKMGCIGRHLQPHHMTSAFNALDTAQVSMWFSDTSTGTATRAGRYGSMLKRA